MSFFTQHIKKAELSVFRKIKRNFNKTEIFKVASSFLKEKQKMLLMSRQYEVDAYQLFCKSRNFYFSAKHTATYYWLILLTMASNASILRGCLCDNWKSIFLPLLIFEWRTFSRRVTAWWWRQSAKKIKCRPIRTREIGGVSLSDVLYT